MATLVIGGARSGKSRFAQSLGANALGPICLATAHASDAEMAARIARHRLDRADYWRTIEEPLHIADAAKRYHSDCDFLLLDCLTVWLSNPCWEHRDKEERG